MRTGNAAAGGRATLARYGPEHFKRMSEKAQERRRANRERRELQQETLVAGQEVPEWGREYRELPWPVLKVRIAVASELKRESDGDLLDWEEYERRCAARNPKGEGDA